MTDTNAKTDVALLFRFLPRVSWQQNASYDLSVRTYVFPAWAQTWIPGIAFVAAGLVALGLWKLTMRARGKMVITYCLLGGVLGSLTHLWAVYRGIVTRPPMLQGASPLAAVVIAFFEYIFYWCAILVLASILHWMQRRLKDKRKV